MTRPASIFPVSWAWVTLRGGGREGHTAFVGLYRDHAAACEEQRFAIQAVIAGNGKMVRQARICFRTAKQAFRHFRHLCQSLASEKWPARVLGEPAIKMIQ